ncbi:hypothetical protein CR513_13460, partial [Mucuna pruriens]
MEKRHEEEIRRDFQTQDNPMAISVIIANYRVERGRHIKPNEHSQVHLLELDPRFGREDARPQPNEDLKEI